MSRLAYYKYKDCTVIETPSCFVATNEHGATIGASQTSSGAEGIIDDYVQRFTLENKEPKQTL